MGLLSQDEILHIHQATLDADLARSRDGLLAGIAKEFAASLATSSTTSTQILSDLHALNDVPRLQDGSCPFAIWLLNAEVLAGRRVQADTFQFMRRRVAGDRIEGDPRTRPESIRSKPRLGWIPKPRISCTMSFALAAALLCVPWMAIRLVDHLTMAGFGGGANVDPDAGLVALPEDSGKPTERSVPVIMSDSPPDDGGKPVSRRDGGHDAPILPNRKPHPTNR